MNLKCQHSSVNLLSKLAKNHVHSIIIEGPKGCGKTYLAKEYSKLLNVPDFQLISPNVSEIRNTINEFYSLNNDVVLCIENLDLGVAAASYALLKFLEEPKKNAYIVITCRNIAKIPDTILSRSSLVNTSRPIPADIELYAQEKDKTNYREKQILPIWKCVKSFNDVDLIFNMTTDQLNYFANIDKNLNFNKPISQLVWDIGHYSDGSECPVEIMLRYIMNFYNNPHINRCAVECLNDIASGRVASHASIARFCFDAKFGG